MKRRLWAVPKAAPALRAPLKLHGSTGTPCTLNLTSPLTLAHPCTSSQEPGRCRPSPLASCVCCSPPPSCTFCTLPRSRTRLTPPPRCAGKAHGVGGTPDYGLILKRVPLNEFLGPCGRSAEVRSCFQSPPATRLLTQALDLPWNPALTLRVPFSTLQTPFPHTHTHAQAKEELKRLGPMSRDEKITAFALGLTVCLWIGGQSLGINAVAAALAGLSILLVTSESCFVGGETAAGSEDAGIHSWFPHHPCACWLYQQTQAGRPPSDTPHTCSYSRVPLPCTTHPHLPQDVVTWEQCLSDNQAWDTLTWFAALIAMAAYLNKYGFISWFSDKVGPGISGCGPSVLCRAQEGLRPLACVASPCSPLPPVFRTRWWAWWVAWA